MKNYTYDWVLQDKGFIERPEEKYTDSEKDMKKYIDLLSDVVAKAKCGWDSVQYKVMENSRWNTKEQYMVLCVDGRGERYIPITGNSKGCNLQVLGENIW